eukprot:scaffold286_cov169-Amphora_coffeaeformis.AAC.21
MQRDSRGWLPLHSACRFGHLNTLHAMLDRMDKPLDPSDWAQAVELASEGGHFEILKFFLVVRIVAMV